MVRISINKSMAPVTRPLMAIIAKSVSDRDEVTTETFCRNVPRNTSNSTGFWWDTVSAEAASLMRAGSTAVPTPALAFMGESECEISEEKKDR